MASRGERIGSFARRAALSLLAILVLLFALTRFQQRLFRYRAERLVSDLQSVRVYKSTWADAQRLMTRWSAWGHYEGTCTAVACKYQIALGDWGSEPWRHMSGDTWDRLARFHAAEIYGWIYHAMGGRSSDLDFKFTVRNDIVSEASTHLSLESNWGLPKEIFSGELIVSVDNRPTLGGVRDRTRQMAEHPNYRVGHPDGCGGCEMARISYAPQITEQELKSFTAFDFSCFARYHGCMDLEQLLPASRPWQLYYYPWGEGRLDEKALAALPSEPCSMPIWAIGRDAGAAFVVDALSIEQERHWEDKGQEEIDKARLLEVLRGTAPWAVGTILTVHPYEGWMRPPSSLPEHLEPGHRYIAVVEGDGHFTTPDMGLDRCGVLDDTPEVRRQLRQGFDMADAYR